MTGFTILLLVLLLSACQQQPVATPFAATIPPSNGISAAAQGATAVPTANPLPSRTPTLPPTVTFTPSPTPTITPSFTPTLTPTITLTPTLTLTTTPIASPTPTDPANDPNNTPVPTWTPPPPDPASQIADHYHLRRPIADSGTNWVARTYPYGNTSGGRLQVHLGVDMENPTGTPIRAAADGTVFYAGDDNSQQFGPSTAYYGNLVILQHSFQAVGGQPVFTLYGHMSRVDVTAGQAVRQGDQIGVVGGTGVAFGPHLHFEVRVGEANNYRATRNPELWIFPFQGFGTLAGRVTDTSGAVLYDVTLQVKSTDISRYAFSYADNTVNPDSVFGENFVLGDLPANYYNVTVSENGRVRFQQMIYVFPNRTTWIDVQLKP